MFFSKISGLWREENYIFIRGEYHNAKFHINEIGSIQIVDANDSVCTVDQLPICNAKLLFLLKSGRKKTYDAGKLSINGCNICWMQKNGKSPRQICMTGNPLTDDPHSGQLMLHYFRR